MRKTIEMINDERLETIAGGLGMSAASTKLTNRRSAEGEHQFFHHHHHHHCHDQIPARLGDVAGHYGYNGYYPGTLVRLDQAFACDNVAVTAET